MIFAGVQGVEPRLPGPKPGVLPLDDPAALEKMTKPLFSISLCLITEILLRKPIEKQSSLFFIPSIRRPRTILINLAQ